MNNISVIIPLHKYDDEVKKYLNEAVKSVEEQAVKPEKVFVVSSKEVNEQIRIDLGERVEYIINKGNLDYCTQINVGAKECKTKYFSVLAFDDKYNKTWFKSVNKYTETMPEYSIYLPIVNFIDSDDKMMGFANELIWAMSFSNELGVIDADVLEHYHDFSINGGVFRVDDFLEVGGLKPSIKLSFWYEFLLRATKNDVKIYVIPKSGYFHLVDRKGSIMDEYSKTMDEEERLWWVKLASKESLYKKDRKKEYKNIKE